MSGDQLNLDDILARVDDEDFYPAHDELEADVRALVAEVRRLRADREMGRTNLAHYSEIIDAQAGEIEALLARLDMARDFSFRVAEERLGITPPNLDAP